MGLEVAVLVAFLPDHALQRLERGGLAVLVDPAQQHFDHFLPWRLDDAGFLGRLVQPVLHLWLVAVGFDEGRQTLARVRKQYVLDEADRAGGALDIGDDGADDGHAGKPGYRDDKLTRAADYGRVAWPARRRYRREMRSGRRGRGVRHHAGEAQGDVLAGE